MPDSELSLLLSLLHRFSFAVMIWLFAFKWSRIRKYDFVIIQTPTLVVAKSAMVLFKGLYGKRCILNVSDIWPLTAVDMGAITKESRSYRFMEKLERYLYRKADGVFGQSEEILNHVAAKMNTNLTNSTNRNKTTDGTDMDPDSEDVLGSEMWKEDKRLFLYRNLQTYDLSSEGKKRGEPLRMGWLRLPLSRLGIVQASVASALAAPSV